MITINDPAPKRFRLLSGEMGTEYQAIRELIVRLRADRQRLDDRLEELQRQLEVAAGNPW